ncbi:hypothetical protein LARV_01029 [Longilinea arvoryzae]|uniref:Concanavalin A-like lectin/glucanases superfamily n=1 Tax=Longilinea arvoryzae TaxID=360412 RepID=A0A0S7B7C7_9CHLR|nr:hypothetical protein [Longilinea arvoryzae]GAP13276.1 hypothetical protein LARV_01029 [Longilinea arvoryzae]
MKKHAWRIGLCLGLLLTLSGCAELLGTAQPLPTETPTVTPQPSATIQWFPDTPTPTPVPPLELLPTPAMRPGVGELLLEDDFSSASDWPTQKTDSGTVGLGANQLSIVISQPGVTLSSLRKTPDFGDFYLEVTVNPSMCKTDDRFGVLLRAQSEGDYYRLISDCAGNLRLERVLGGSATVVQNWTATILVRPPLSFKLGVWVYKKEMRVFVEDSFQFSASDPMLTGGRVGFYARAANQESLSVSFADLKVYALESGNIPPTPTITPTVTRTPRK